MSPLHEAYALCVAFQFKCNKPVKFKLWTILSVKKKFCKKDFIDFCKWIIFTMCTVFSKKHGVSHISKKWQFSKVYCNVNVSKWASKKDQPFSVI